MRDEYLFALAHWCHIPPAEVDRLQWRDFLLLLDGIDAAIESMKG